MIKYGKTHEYACILGKKTLWVEHVDTDSSSTILDNQRIRDHAL